MDWNTLIEREQRKPYFQKLQKEIDHKRSLGPVYPDNDDVFTAFDLCPYDKTRVVIIGQDPYHQPNQAMGMSFSVSKETPLPKSLINIFKELNDDLSIQNIHGDLSAWAKQGVLMLNTILTVDESKPMSHQRLGWEQFTNEIMLFLNNHPNNLVFILWGKKAQEYKVLFDERHHFIESSHPSPLGVYKGFWGSKPFSRTNNLLIEMGSTPIDWSNHDTEL